MNTNKRIMAAVLAVFMVLGMLPAVFAAEYKLDLKNKPDAEPETVFMDGAVNDGLPVPATEEGESTGEAAAEDAALPEDGTEEAAEPESDEESAAAAESEDETAPASEEADSAYPDLPKTVRFGDIVHIAAGELPVYILPASLGEDYIRNIPANVPEYRVEIDFDLPGDTYTVEITEGPHPWACESDADCPHLEEGETECPYKGDYVGIIFYLNARPHAHTYSEEWVISEEGHCSICTNSDGNCTDPVSETEEHIFEDGTCTVCGFYSEKAAAADGDETAEAETPEDELTEGETATTETAEGEAPEHIFSLIWKADSENHWRECTMEECTLDYANLSEEEAALASFGTHEYAENGDERFTCTVCGHVNEELKAAAEHDDLLNAVRNAAAAARNEISAIENLPEDQSQAAYNTIADIESTAIAAIEAAGDYETAAAVKDAALRDISDVVKPIKLEAAKEAAKQSLRETAGDDKSSLVQIALEDAIAAIDACETIAGVESVLEAAEAEIRDYLAFNAKKAELVESISESVNENDTVEAHKIAADYETDITNVIYNKEASLEENLEILTEMWTEGKVKILKQKAADDTQEALGNVTVGISTDIGAQLSGTTKSKLTNMLICSPAMSEDVIKAIAVGEAVRLVVQVKNNPAPDPTEKDLIVKAATGFELVAWLDVSLYATVDGTNYAIPETRDKISIVLRVPANLVNNNPAVTRTYIIGRAHNNIADLITPNFSKTNLTLTFQTDKFSTYAYGYRDNGGGDIPKTGDDSMPVLWIALMGISLAGLGVIVVKAGKKNRT